MRVRSLMTTAVHSCTPEQTLADAARVMWEHDVGCVPVIDEGGRPLGVITDRDVCMTAYLRGNPLGEMQVASAMSPSLFSCHLNDSVTDAERTMMTRQVRRLPVVDDHGVMVAILSLNDIVLNRTRSTLSKFRERLRGNVVETLAAISRHRSGRGAQAAE